MDKDNQLRKLVASIAETTIRFGDQVDLLTVLGQFARDMAAKRQELMEQDDTAQRLLDY